MVLFRTNKEEIADAKRNLPAQVFKELYEAEASDDGGNPFGLSSILGCILPEMGSGLPAVWGFGFGGGLHADGTGAVSRVQRARQQ